MTPEMILWLSIGAAALVLALSAAAWIASLRVTAAPDQWLLHIRDGCLVEAGVGIRALRRPGDVVVRFSSTVQRVRFEVECLSRDRIPVSIEGFILWSVSPQDQSPLLAYQKMGLTDASDQAADMRARNHLLTTPQHRAFRKIITAEVQRHASTMALTHLLSVQDDVVEGVRARLTPLTDALGVAVDQVQINAIRPVDAELLSDMAAEQVEAVRGEAARVRLEAAEATKQREVASETRLARQASASRTERQAAEARDALELERERAALEAQKLELTERRMELERDRERLEQQLAHELALERAALEGARELEAESRLLALERARAERAQLTLEARLAGRRAEALADRDAALALAEAEEQKSPEVRAHELQRETVASVAAALGNMPIRDARWVSVGDSNPLGSLMGLFEGLRASGATIGEEVEA